MVYMMLRAYYNKDKGYAYPTFVQIANFTKLSKKTVIKIIDELVYLDIINVDNEGWRKINENFQKSNNMYSINFEGRKEFTRDIDSYEDTKKIMLKVQSIKNTSNKKQSKRQWVEWYYGLSIIDGCRNVLYEYKITPTWV